MPRKHITWAGDFVRHLKENLELVESGALSSQTAHAQNSSVGRSMSVINTIIRYDRARHRGEVRKLTFMHKPVRATKAPKNVDPRK